MSHAHECNCKQFSISLHFILKHAELLMFYVCVAYLEIEKLIPNHLCFSAFFTLLCFLAKAKTLNLAIFALLIALEF